MGGFDLVEKVYRNTKLLRHIIRFVGARNFRKEVTKPTHIGFASVAKRIL